MVLKIVLPILIVFCLYYLGIFIYYYRKTRVIKTALRNTLVLVLPLVILLLCVEFVFRIIISNSILHKDDRFFTRNFATAYYFVYAKSNQRTTRYVRLREPTPNFTEILDPIKTYEVPYKTLPYDLYTYHTDKDGFVTPEYQNGKRTLFFIGGSTTECMFVHEKLRFSYLTGEALKQNALNYTVKNAGFSGNNTFHSVDNIINKVLPFHPETIVLMEAINDLSILLWEKTYHNKNPHKSLIIDDVYKGKNIEDAHADEFIDKRGNVQSMDTNIIFTEYRRALRLFINICRAEDIRPVLMTQFNRIEPGQINSCRQLHELVTKYNTHFTQSDFISLYKRMNAIVREVASEQDVHLIDLDLLVPKSDKYIYDAVHLNDSGSVLVANIVSEHLTKYLQQQH